MPNGTKWGALALLTLAVGCGSSTGGGAPDSGTPDGGGSTPPTITIAGYAYSPLELTVDAGTTLRLVNQDGMQHSVTSESADGDFTPGGVNGVTFDSGLFSTTASIVIPASATSGTVIPYYCAAHKSGMATPNGHITIR